MLNVSSLQLTTTSSSAQIQILSRARPNAYLSVALRGICQSQLPETLCGRELPWIKSANHLRHELHETGQMEHDASIKRARSVEIRENFDFASPFEVLRAMKVYCST